MNKIIKVIFATVTLSALVVGCATNNANQTATTQALVVAASSTGTALVLQKNPTDVVYFVAAQQVLNTISTGTNQISVNTVEAALSKSGETNAIVNLAVADGIALADTYVQNTVGTNNPVAQNAAVQQACGWIALGIGQGIQAVGK